MDGLVRINLSGPEDGAMSVCLELLAPGRHEVFLGTVKDDFLDRLLTLLKESRVE